MPACLIDVRCLQDPVYAGRGIGRHARVLLAHGRAGLPGVRLVGLVDAGLPPLPDAVRAMLDEVRSTAYTGALTTPCCHVQLSPMTHDPLFVARLLHHPAIPAATVVYDFIPLQEPERYLPDPAARVEYHLSLRWLARHQMFLPISADAAAGLVRLLGVPEGRIAVTGAPLGAGFAGVAPGAGMGRHVLVVGGPDPRKNPDCAIRAHARCLALQRAGVPVVVTGVYDADWLCVQREAAAALGGDPALVRAPGHVDEAALLRLYADAVCVVAPSRAEGFSLPVVEAMAAGVPVLGSDIAAHRELLDAAVLFPAEDDAVLAGLLGRVGDAGWRAEVVARQAGVWPRFTGAAVAERFWAGVRRLVPGRAPAIVVGRPRVALLTPLPPDPSGVADYSAALCVELARRVELHVLTPTRAPVRPAGVASVEPLSALPALHSGFDRVVGVLGNSLFHLEILRLLLRYGGAAILHDGRMLDLYASHISLPKTVRMAEAELGRALDPQEIWHWLAGDVPPEALILAEIAEAAEPLMMHSAAGAADVTRRHGRAVTHLPFSLYRMLPEAALVPGARQAARARLGVRPDEVLLASFGYIHPTKAPLDCIWALDLVRSWGVDARLHLVGSPLMPMEPLEALIGALGLGAQVRLGGGYVDEAVYRDTLVGADVGIQLRTSGGGAVSGALADCVAAGLPSVASRTLAEAIDAPAYVRAVPDAPSPVLVAEAAMALLGAGPTVLARRAYVAAHGFDRYSARLCAALGLELGLA